MDALQLRITREVQRAPAEGEARRARAAAEKIDLTTPHQRTRSVLQTRLFLARLAQAQDIAREVQDEARRLLCHYPEPWHLSRAHERVPADWGSVEAVKDEAAGLSGSGLL